MTDPVELTKKGEAVGLNMDLQGVALALLGAIMTLLGWIGKLQVKRIDRLEKRVVSREEVGEMHKDNKEELEKIKSMLEEQNRTASRHRERTERTLGMINQKVAVIRSKLGDNPFADGVGSDDSRD